MGWILLALTLTLALAITVWARGFLHHAIRQPRNDKTAPQPPRAYLDALTTEATATLSILINRIPTWYQPPPEPIPTRTQGPPILLVPDPALPWASLADLSRILQEHELTNVHILDAKPHKTSLETLGHHAQETLETITKDAGSLAIGIGHGSGGLALRWAHDHASNPLMAHLITVGTPHQGTHQPPYRGLPSNEIEPHSTALEALDPTPLVPSTSIFSHLDDRVIPASSARWGDQAIAIPGVGHRGLLWSTRSTRIILAATLAAIAEG